MTKSKGFLYVASTDYRYYKAAIYSIESLKDYWPEANVTIVTHEDWVDKRCRDCADVILTDGVPNHHRAKLWALNKTPYDVTAYMDCDTEIIHEDIEYIFDELDEDSDMAMGIIRSYAVAITKVSDGEFTWHCGVFLYRSNSHTLDLLYDWWNKYIEWNREWPFDEEVYPKKQLAKWDTFTFWWLTEKGKYKDLVKINTLDVRFNFISSYRTDELDAAMVVYHKPLPCDTPKSKNQWKTI